MKEKFVFCNLLKMTAWALLPVLLLTSLPGQALTYRPRKRVERPTQQEAGGSRGPCWQAGAKPVLVPLLTRDNYGETIAEYPTLYWLTANHRYNWMRFELFATQNQIPTKYPDYSTTFRTQSTAKLSHLRLSAEAGFPPLKLNQEYLWKVTLICSTDGPDSEFAAGGELSIQGWIKRVDLPASLKSKLAAAKGSTIYNLYAQEGLWYDAVAELAAQYRPQPNNVELASDWQQLLKLLPMNANVTPLPRP